MMFACDEYYHRGQGNESVFIKEEQRQEKEEGKVTRLGNVDLASALQT